MSDDAPTSVSTAAAVILVVCLLVAPVQSVSVASASGVGGSESVGASEVGSDTFPDGAVSPALRSANGTVEVVVRFAGDARVQADSSGDGGSGGPAGSATLSATDLKTGAQSAQADFESFAEGRSAITVERRFWLANAMLVTVDTDRVPVERLLDVRGVKRVHENFRIELDSVASGAGSAGAVDGPSAPPTPESVAAASTGTTYGVEMVRAPEVWETFDTRGGGATVAVLDTGIDPDHPDLSVSGWAEFDTDGNLVSDDVSDASDGDGHGTHVAGTVAGGNASGTAIGVAPNASIHGIKVFDDDGTNATFTRVIAGMEHATQDSEVDVLQMSLGADGHFPAFIEPVRNARSAGKIVVASSGNRVSEPSSTPGNVYDSLAVGAVDSNRDVPSFSGGETIDTSSTWGSDAPAGWPDEYVVPDVSAPGVNVYSAEPGGRYTRKDGTSMAAPHVSGVAALMLSAASRSVSDDELYDTLRDTANHPTNATDPDDRYGTGIVDGYAAVSTLTENRSNLSVTAFDAPAETAPRATLETTATINNAGSAPGTGTVEYRFNDTVADTATVSLDAGESATVDFSYVVPSDTEANRSYDHGAYTADSNRTVAIDVVDTPFYEVTNLTAASIVERNATLGAAATVTNLGGADGVNRSVDLRLTDPENASRERVLDAANVSLGAGENATVDLNGTVPSDFGTGATELAVASPEESVSASVRIAEAVGTVNGTVTDAESDTTLSGIEVVARNGTETVGETATGADGTYAVDVPAGELTVTASNATYAPASESVTLNGSGDTATANLSPSLRNGTLSGAVGASDGLEPPANATVTVANETGHAVASVDAAADGTYEVELRPGTYDLTASAPDFDPDDAASVTVEPNATTTENLALGSLPATLSGTVTAAETDDPIDGANVTVEPEAGGGTVETTTDTAGDYSLGTGRGDYDLTVSADGYADATRAVSLPSNGSIEENVSLSTPANFTVTDLSGPSEIEQGATADLNVTIENVGGTAGDVTVTFAVSPGDTADSRSFSGVASGATRSTTFSVSVADDGQTGTYDATASTPDDTETTSFEVVSGGTDSNSGSGGGGGGGGGTTPAPAPAPPSTEDPNGPESETDSPTNETDSPTNQTDGPTNQTDEPTDGVDGPVGDEPTGGDEEADGEVGGGDDGAGEPNEESGGDETTDEGGSTDGAPGFGPPVGVLAVLAVALFVRWRGERD